MPHATIIGMHYAPEPAGNAPYTTSLAEHLASVGWDVHVVTGQPHYPEWRKTPAPAHGVVNGVTISRTPHYVPSTPTTIGRGLMELTWYASTLRRARATTGTDIVIGVIPTLSGAWLALAAARRAGVPCVLWFQDLMGQAARQSGIEGGGRVVRLVQALELSVARQSDTVLVVAESFRPYLLRGGISLDRIQTARNWNLLPSARRTRSEARVHFGFDSDRPVALHSGNMGLKQGLDIVIDVAERIPDTTFVLQGNGSQREHLKERAASMQLSNVVFMPTLGAADLADLLACVDVLLLTQRPSVTDMSLPSKLNSYLASGTPIVASVNDASETRTMLDEAAAGSSVTAGDVAELANAIETMKNRSTTAPGSTGRSGYARWVDRQLVGTANIERILETLLDTSHEVSV